MGQYDLNTQTLHDAATGTGNGEVVSIMDHEGNKVVIQIGGTVTDADLTFEATLDGETWSVVRATNLSTGSAVTTVSASGIYLVDAEGFSAVRVPISRYADGTITAKARAVRA